MLFDSEIATWNNLWLVLKIISIPTALKLWIWLQSLRLYGVYRLYKNREVFFNHEIFKELDRLLTDQELFNRIQDTARREIFKDVFRVEVMGLNEVLISFREYLYKEENFFKFIHKHRKLDSNTMLSFFLRLYNAHRDKIAKKVRFKLKSGGLDSLQIMFITQKYYEFTEENSYVIRKKIEVLRNRNNIFYSVTDILDRFEIEIDSRRIFLPEKFLKLNGKLNNISYKGYESYIETNRNIQAIQEEANV